MNTAIGRLYPTTKFVIVLIVVILSVIETGYVMQYMIFPLIIVLSFMSKTAKQFINAFIKSVFPIVVFIFLMQVFLVPNDDQIHVWAFIHFSNRGLQESLTMSSKIVAVSSALLYFFQVTKVKDIIFALEKLKVPKKMTFLISSTIQMIPQMTSLSKVITDAQKSRGIESQGNLFIRMRAFIPMIGPLVLSSIQQAEERMLALESRAFSSNARKTSLYLINKRRVDKAIEILCLTLLLIYIIWRNI